jgi:hypothetical protein
MVSRLDIPALKKAQESVDAMASQEIVRKAVFNN